jgi:iron complex outermembrane receptor protein
MGATLLDVERVEVVRGPASAMYGPDAVGGVMDVVTASPIDRPGTRATVTGGERGLFQGAARQAFRFDDRSGLQFSGRYVRGMEWTAEQDGGQSTAEPFTESGGGSALLDLRPWRDGSVVVEAGLSRLVNSVLQLEAGPARASGWSQEFARARVRKGRLWGQGWVNRGDAGSSTYVSTGAPVVDRSTALGAQLRYGRAVSRLLDVTAGVDATHTAPGTGGTLHGAWEHDDAVDELGGYLHGSVTPGDGVRLVGALRADLHSRLDGVRFSPRVALEVDAGPGREVYAAYNSGYVDPTPGLLFADHVTSGIRPSGTPGFDLRVVGLPEGSLTFRRRCPGGLGDLCMYSPFLPGVRIPATGGALWDSALVPLALESPSVLEALAGMGITPNGFAQIIGRPAAADLESRLVRWNEDTGAFEAAAAPQEVAPLRPASVRSFEVGFRGSGSRYSYFVELHADRIDDLVAPVRVVTPTLFLDAASVEAFLMRRMQAVGVPAGVADRVAGNIAATTSAVPLGTLTPDQREDADVLLVHGNQGPVRYWGGDVGGLWQVTRRIGVSGSVSFLSADCFDLEVDGVCGGGRDVTLNAPKVSASTTVRWADPVAGVTLEGRVRHAGAFPMNAGVYQGQVPAHTLLDVHGRFVLPWAPGAALSVTVTNVLDARRPEVAGGPRIGRLGLMSLHYAY